jgi:hypothetical protein
MKSGGVTANSNQYPMAKDGLGGVTDWRGSCPVAPHRKFNKHTKKAYFFFLVDARCAFLQAVAVGSPVSSQIVAGWHAHWAQKCESSLVEPWLR